MTRSAPLFLLASFALSVTAQPGCDSTFFVQCFSSSQLYTGFFQATSGGQADGYVWNFGDGSLGYGQAAQHQYTQPGQYYVCVNAWYWDAGTQDTCWTKCCQWLTLAGLPSPCDSLNADFLASGTGPGVNFANDVIDLSWIYQWDFGDGSLGSGPNPFHIYAQPGQYEACLTVWTWDPFTQDTCFSVSCEWLTITTGSGCSGLDACFVPSQFGPQNFFFNNCSSTPDPNSTQYLWVFGDGTTSTAIAPTHAFPQGVWTVCLYTYYQNCMDSTCTVIASQGNSGCDSTFFVQCFASSQLYTGFFQATSGGQANGYIWDFGDGSVGYGQAAQHIYTQPGQYYTCVNAWYWDAGTQDTCWASCCQWLTISGTPDPCDAFAAYWTSWSPAPQTVEFIASVNYGSLVPTLLEWSFDDGTFAYTDTVTHTFPAQTLYNVCLTVWGYDPQTQDTCMITICNPIDFTPYSPCDSLNAGFTPSSAGLGVNFTNHVTDPQWNYHWAFGDGTIGSGPNPYHQFPQPGTYATCLTVWTWDPLTQDTCSVVWCYTFSVNGPDPCDSLMAGYIPQQVQPSVFVFVNATSTPDPQATTYFWDFGDGTTSSAVTPTHQFPPGVWTVCLIATWQNCVDTICTVIQAGTGAFCDSTFFNTFSWLDQGSGILVFSGAASLPAPYGWWDFGDGTTGFGNATQHYYTASGDYYVCFTSGYWDQQVGDTCTATHCQWVTVSGNSCDSLVTADFMWQSQGQVMFFDNLSMTSGYPASYYWNFGDGTWDYSPDPIHTFPDTSMHLVCLTAGIWNGTDSCFMTTCQQVLPGSNGSTGTSVLDISTEWTVSPNPTNGSVQLTLTGNETNVHIALLDVQGRLVHAVQPSGEMRYVIDLGTLPRGVYLLRVRNDAAQRTFRVVRE